MGKTSLHRSASVLLLALVLPPYGTLRSAGPAVSVVEVPRTRRDHHGNPVLKGKGPRTGHPREIWYGAMHMEFVLVEPGEFQMGSPENEEGRHANEGPVHTVRITKPFYLGKYEVTQEQWRKVTGTAPWLGRWGTETNSSSAASYISWHDCQRFLKGLSVGGAEFCLPTEAQWEYACRAGTRTRFYFGDHGGDIVVRVGEHAEEPNGWGLYDMYGNVREWCRDWYGEDYYVRSPKDDPEGPRQGSERSVRGGSRNSNWGSSAARTGSDPAYANPGLGLRVCFRNFERFVPFTIDTGLWRLR